MPPPAVTRTTSQGPPGIIVKEGSTREKGKNIRSNSIHAAKLLAEMLKSSVGPHGMDKMFIDKIGEIVITNNGAMMLQKMKVDHPAARILAEAAEATHSEVGDGAASTVILAAALLEKAEELISDGVHPNTIVAGYTLALRKSIEILDELAEKVSPIDENALIEVARTNMRTRLFSREAEHLARLVVAASTQIAEKRGDDGYRVVHDTIKIEKRPGGSLQDSILINGVVLDKQIVLTTMTKRVENAKVAVLNDRLYIEKPKFAKEQFDAVVTLTDPAQIKRFKEVRDATLKGWAEKLISSGANVVINEMGIDDLTTYYLGEAGILALNRTLRGDIGYLAKATGARIVNDFHQFSSDDLGEAALVEERSVDSRRLIFVEGCKNPRAVTIFLRGATKETVEEAGRAVKDALTVVKDVIENPAVVAGGGACETEVASRIRHWSEQIPTREQLPAEKFAEALEIIPLTLAKNAGMDIINTMTELRAKHAEGGLWYGVDAESRKVRDVYKENIIEPLAVKQQMLKAATEAACMMLRVDLAFTVTRVK
jgi:archaeal chaperonin